MQQPTGFVDPALPTHVCRLHKSLYGLKQALRAWYTRLSNFLLSIGFCASKVDTSLFILTVNHDIIWYLFVYVDDILLTGNNSTQIHRLISLLSSEFKLRDLGHAHYFFGNWGHSHQHGAYASLLIHRLLSQRSVYNLFIYTQIPLVIDKL